jgi:hypothetical protein
MRIVVAPQQANAAITVTAVELHRDRVVVDIIADQKAADALRESVGLEVSGFAVRDDLGTAYGLFGSEGGGTESVRRMAMTCRPAVPPAATELVVETIAGEVRIGL